MMNDLQQVIDRHEKTLEVLLKNSSFPCPIIQEALIYSLFPGGKRIRPLLVYLTGTIVDAPLAALDVIAAAIELTHCYSLIHDDLPAMDNDDFRRGKASCHRAFGEATAILVGDALQALAMEVLLDGLTPLLTPEKIVLIGKELVHAIGPSGMVSGQSLDLRILQQDTCSQEELIQIHQLKTSKLMIASVKMAALAGSATKELMQELTNFANLFGLVFQMQDDYLDAYAPVSHLGKGRSSDAANEKITFARCYTQEDLAKKISAHFNAAQDILDHLGPKAHHLQLLLQQLEQRSRVV